MATEGRPSVMAKRTHIRAQKHEHSSNDKLIYKTMDCAIIGLSYAGIAAYVYRNFSKISPYELGGIAVGSLGLGYSIFDLGKRQGITQGADFALRSVEDAKELKENLAVDDWKGEFKGQEFAKLIPKDKVTWLQSEATRIKELQGMEHQRCGQAYIKREESYKKYERHGGYGGADWKRYAEANDECTAIYELCQKQQKRLVDIEQEIAYWSRETL